jgi:hypothetical protein
MSQMLVDLEVPVSELEHVWRLLIQTPDNPDKWAYAQWTPRAPTEIVLDKFRKGHEFPGFTNNGPIGEVTVHHSDHAKALEYLRAALDLAPLPSI